MSNLYEKCSDSQLKDTVKFILKHKSYKANSFTDIATSISESKNTLSKKQRDVLINHLITNEKII